MEKKKKGDKKIKVTLSVDGDSFRNFKEYCKKRGMKVSSKIDLMIKDELKKS